MMDEQEILNQRWQGDAYHVNSKPQWLIASNILRHQKFKGHEEVLDVGCGDGKITKNIALEKVQNGSVLGIDISESMIATASKLYHNIPNLHFQKAGAESFSLNHTYDVVVSFTALHWVFDQLTAWKNIRKHLKPGGYALVSLNPPPICHYLEKAVLTTLQKPRWADYFTHFQPQMHMAPISIDEYKKLITQAGLTIEVGRHSHLFFEFDHKADMIGNVKAWLPHVSQIPEHLQDSFMEEIIDDFLAFSGQKPDQLIHLKFNNFMIKAFRDE